MAKQPYKETDSINNMTTRQLRQYISDKATEAQARLDSLNMKKAPEALKNQLTYITNKQGTKIRRSTSYMDRETMVEYAFNLREFNMLDTSSKYSRDKEWIDNRSRYEAFIRNTQNPNKNADYSAEFAEYWNQFINKDGTISKRGYREYKRYIQLYKSVGDKEQYGYIDFKKEAVQMLQESKRVKKARQMLDDLFVTSDGTESVETIVDKFETVIADYDRQQKARAERKVQQRKSAKRKKTVKNIQKVAKSVKPKQTKKKGKSDIKVKQAGKMRTNATIRERIK